MLNYTPHKPVYPAMISAPDDTQIYKHRGESTAAWENYGELVNYFQVMMKLFPKFEVEGYQTGKETTTTEAGIGTYAEVEPDQRGTDYKLRVDGDLGERYGDWHRIGRAQGDFWGYDPHEQIAENLNWDPAADSWEGFSDGLFSGGSNAPIETRKYLRAMYGEDEAVSYADDFGEITDREWSGVNSYLAQYGDMSFYEIVMQGVDGVRLPGNAENKLDWNAFDGDASDGIDWSAVGGTFSYDSRLDYNGQRGLGAYYMMLGLLETFRRVGYAYSSLFGEAQNIVNNDSSAMVAHFDNVLSTDLRGLDDHNLQLLYMYLQQPAHSLHTLFAAFRGGAVGEGGGYGRDPETGEWCGHMYSARDQVAFKRFRDTVLPAAQAYIDSLEGDEQVRAQALLNEYKYELTDAAVPEDEDNMIYQPWGGDARQKINSDGEIVDNANDPRWAGWDYFSATDLFFNGRMDPSYANDMYRHCDATPSPLMASDGEHYGYVYSQVRDVSNQAIKRENYFFNGGYYDMSNNWVVNAASRFLEAKDIDNQRAVNALGVNSLNKRLYKIALRRYKNKVKAAKEKKWTDADLKNLAEKHAAERKADMQRANRKRKEKASLWEDGSLINHKKASAKLNQESTNRLLKKMYAKRRNQGSNQKNK